MRAVVVPSPPSPPPMPFYRRTRRVFAGDGGRVTRGRFRHAAVRGLRVHRSGRRRFGPGRLLFFVGHDLDLREQGGGAWSVLTEARTPDRRASGPAADPAPQKRKSVTEPPDRNFDLDYCRCHVGDRNHRCSKQTSRPGRAIIRQFPCRPVRGPCKAPRGFPGTAGPLSSSEVSALTPSAPRSF